MCDEAWCAVEALSPPQAPKLRAQNGMYLVEQCKVGVERKSEKTTSKFQRVLELPST
jgi:hypothetical protein